MRVTDRRTIGEQGVSILEVIVVVGILSLLISMAVVSLQSLYRTFDKSHAIQEFLFDVRRAKNSALSEGARIIFDFGTDGYTVGIDRAPFSSPAAGDEILWMKNFERGVYIDADSDFIFDSRGMLIDVNGNLNAPGVSVHAHGSNETFSFYASGFPNGL